MYNELPVQGETVEVERVRQRERERNREVSVVSH